MPTEDPSTGRDAFDPVGALQPGRSDARNLLTLWFIRKSHYGILAIGLSLVAVSRHLDDHDVSWGDPTALATEVGAPAAGLLLGLAIRVTTSFVGLLMTYPLVREYDIALAPRGGWAPWLSVVLDRLNIGRSFRSLRWSHHVRHEAMVRMQPSGGWLSRLDPMFDLVNITLWVIAVGLTIGTM